MYLQLWRVFSLINPLIGIVLWLIFLLDRACFGSSLGLVSIFIAMVLAIGSLAVLHKRVTEKQELIAISTHLPSIMLGGLYLPPIFVIVIYKIVVLFSLLVILIPALPLGLLFFVSEQAQGTQIQEIASPNGDKIAYVQFTPTGGYGRGYGNVAVDVRFSQPRVARQAVFYLPATYYADENTTDYVQWVDNNTLYILETKEEVSVELQPSLVWRTLVFITETIQSISRGLMDSHRCRSVSFFVGTP